MLDPVRPDRLPLGKEGTYKKAVSGGEDSYLMFHLFSDGRGWEPCPKMEDEDGFGSDHWDSEHVTCTTT